MIKLIKDRIAIAMVSKGKKRQNYLSGMEMKHIDTSSKGFNDSSYFAGLSPDGISFVSRLAFRVDKPNENWLKIFFSLRGCVGL